ncbi:hypothetical protein KAU33_12325 [Candidatus Dependentiae bacterium]|nr:hypothetical protein [Candidatus Dependentiae bacterium]
MRFLNIDELEKNFETKEGNFNSLRDENAFPYLELKTGKIFFSNYIHHLNTECFDRDEEEFQQLLTYKDIFQKRFYFSSYLFKIYTENPPIIVGGSALEYYSGAQYPTGAIDFYLEEDVLDKLIKFLRKKKFYKRGKYYYSLDKKIAVEPHSGHFNGDKKYLNKMIYGDKEVLLIGIEDLIVDRINIFDKKEYPEEYDWAHRLFKSYQNFIDVEYFKRKLKRDGLLSYLEKLKI